MTRLTQFFSTIFKKRRGDLHTDSNVQELRAAFAVRYNDFKLLLTANNKALEIMSELEKALEGNQPLGMSFVRSRCTAVSVNVFKIIKHLDALAPGKYFDLYERFRLIQEAINRMLLQKKLPRGNKLVLPLRSIDRNMADQVGNKMANVAEMRNRIRLSVPNGFVISALAFQKFVEHNDLQTEIDRRIQASNSEEIDDLYRLSTGIQQLIIRAPVPGDVEKAILNAYRELESESGPNVKISLRSSALGEDVAGTSFAGQFATRLNISSENIIRAYKEVVASKYGLPAITYRLSRGIPDEDIAMCVGCMVMLNAAAGGVMYSRNPLNIRDRSVIINSVWGLAKAVVDGTVAPDVFVVSTDGAPAIKQKDISIKEREFVCYPDEGVCRMELTGEKSASQSISDTQALALASMAVRLDEHYGEPQDIEWAVTSEGAIYILQCRPLQQLDRKGLGRPASGEPKEFGSVITRGGVTAASGIACGSVFIVDKSVDKLKFPDGAVLVTSQSLPRWAPLLSRAVAVVTELGGVAGHLASVAREFGVPALFGVPAVTQSLKNGDLVTVDADGLTIYKGRVEPLLAGQEKKKNLMAGSPLYEILQCVTSYIVPLNLLDPDSTEFSPRRCITLHDITRFCHEKSVHEMFNFGKEHRFPERSSKQLVCHVPMQWWVINLDDGFKEDVKGKYVNLDNISSIPMLALWEGVVAVTWEGPPPVDAKGFMSILMQATANPALDPAMQSPYAARNYFMISKNFCSLTSRFGFHFSTVEALVGDRALENYASFTFKGGAADHARKARRAIFIGGILEEFGFRVKVMKDSLFARLEGEDQEVMRKRLRILGYLIIHTRQLDMVMSNDTAIHKYKNKILGDIHSVVNDAASAYPR
ncbi:MAG: PEP/pyruvate-binding domain-containing protein [Desulfomonilaceae bacterium]